MAYLPDVKKRLGDKTVEVISDYSREGKLTSQQLSDFALKLEENSVIFGNHIRRKEGNSYKGGADELRAILCDWWGSELFEMKKTEALQRLIEVLEGPDIGAKPLAAEIKKIKAKEIEGDQSRQNENSPPEFTGSAPSS